MNVVSNTLRIVEQTPEERQEYIDDLGINPGVLFNYYMTYRDEAFVDHVERYLPNRNIRSAIKAGKDFHECGIGFKSREDASKAAYLNMVDLLERLEKVGHPWIDSSKE